jgi:hypothetical protein
MGRGEIAPENEAFAWHKHFGEKWVREDMSEAVILYLNRLRSQRYRTSSRTLLRYGFMTFLLF